MKRIGRLFTIIILIHPLAISADRTEDLRKYAHVVKPLGETRRSTQNFEFLKKYLKDVSIVALGEQSHGDGASISAKVELIKFLHEEMGFNLIAFESSMLDCYRENKAFIEGKKSAKPAIQSSLFPVWTRSRQFQPLIDYISAQKDSRQRLRFAGFDAQPIPLSPAEERFEPVKKILKELNIETSRENIPYLHDLFFDMRSFLAEKPDAAQQKRIMEQIRETGSLIFRNREGHEAKVIGKSIEGAAEILRMYWNADFQNPKNTPDVFNIRDRLMGEFIIFLKDRIYPDEKMILWGANSHLSYSRDEIIEGSEMRMIPAGEYVKNHFRARYYSIAFTSYEGKTGTPGRPAKDVSPPVESSLESLLVEAGFSSCFLDLRGVAASHWLSRPMHGRLYGHSHFKAPWPKITDGLFFIKTMTPSEALME